MIIKNNKILKVSAIATMLSIGLLSAGYTLANKNITLVVKGKGNGNINFKIKC